MKNFILQTERLTVRELAFADAAFILRLLNEPSFIENIGERGVRRLEDAKLYLLQGPLASYSKHGFGLFRVGLKENDTAIGIAGLLKRDYLTAVDLGYALLPEFCGAGYAYEITSALIRHAKDEHALKSLVAIVAENNNRSIMLLQKLGFRADGTVRHPGDNKLLNLYRIDLV
jgi:[ribosomal protein S5]-alanine N-acetyltransferase